MPAITAAEDAPRAVVPIVRRGGADREQTVAFETRDGSALAGQDYDARTRRLTLAPAVPGDVSALLATATGYGLVGVRDGVPFVDVRAGEIVVDALDYRPCAAAR